MKYKLLARMFFLASLMLAAVACTSHVDIMYYDEAEVQAIPKYDYDERYYYVGLLEMSNNNETDNFIQVQVSTDADIEGIMNKHGMHHLYYNVELCSTDYEAYSGLVFPMIPQPKNFEGTVYAAYIERDTFRASLKMMRDSPDGSRNISYTKLLELYPQHGFCLRLGAGSMAGAQLVSNQIVLDNIVLEEFIE